MDIKTGQIQHLYKVLIVENLCFDRPYTFEMLKAIVKNPNTIYLNSFKGGQLTGYIVLEKILDEAEITRTAVVKGYRRTGIAKTLLNTVIEKAKQDGVKRIFLEVNEKNASAIKLYQGAGFKEISQRKRYYGDDTAIIMSLELVDGGQLRVVSGQLIV
jgi:ribosomal-protein-alanine N-acetyltransferase